MLGINGRSLVPRSSLTRKVGFLLLLFWFGAVVAVVLVYRFLDASKHDTHFVNVAGRQRMLAQRVMLHAGMSQVGRERDRRSLAGIVNEFDHAQRALERGGYVAGAMLPPAKGEVRRALGQARTIWDKIRPRLRLEANAPLGDPGTLDRYLEHAIPRLTAAANTVVRIYDVVANRRRDRALVGVVAVAAVELFLLALGLWLTRQFISRPIMALEDAVDRVSAGDFSKRVPIMTRDELAEVTEHFNTMTDHVAQLVSEEREQLRQTEADLRRLLDNAPVGIVCVDKDGIVTRVEGRAMQGPGLHLEARRGKSVLDFDAAPWFSEQVQRALEGESVIGGGDVEGVHLELRYEPVRDAEGEVRGVVCVCTEKVKSGSPAA